MASNSNYGNHGNRHRRRRKHYQSANKGERPRSIVVEMGKYFDGKAHSSMVKVIREDEETGYLMGIPMEEFNFDITEGQRFRIICEPI